MAAPTLISASVTTNTGSVTVTSPTVSWQTGDVVVYIYGSSEPAADTNRSPTNTGSGLSWTFDNVANGSFCAGQLGTAVASASSSGTVTCGSTATGMDNFIIVFVWRNSNGVGNRAFTSSPSATQTVSLTPAQTDSAICWGVFDWAAAAVVSETPTSSSHDSATPGPAALRQAASVTGEYTYYACVLDDQTSGSATSYGVVSGSGPFTIFSVEVEGTAGAAATATPQPIVAPNQAVMRAANW